MDIFSSIYLNLSLDKMCIYLLMNLSPGVDQLMKKCLSVVAEDWNWC